jgi:hypothetical protein
LQGCQLGDLETADGGEANHQTVTLIPQEARPGSEQGGDDKAMHRED